MSVMVPLVVPFTTTLTPGTGSPVAFSVTTPVIPFSCANNAPIEAIRNATISNSFLDFVRICFINSNFDFNRFPNSDSVYRIARYVYKC
ncbi:hypothetical protein JCM21142_104511 [Saccharicrinis fermentans DSM 9555 = JCM 21142]|uniref:Uncharacterized protein n=1 Tax=Saccharicrinis fermentans DSM 9555 = JCM 21142 TaxID=869213 RepID=W7YTI4_9BACT|nr:hypothetical protein JCM21142_104511 [Saccharicrinis fermentans DSM 9555 = JCM 21142]